MLRKHARVFVRVSTRSRRLGKFRKPRRAMLKLLTAIVLGFAPADEALTEPSADEVTSLPSWEAPLPSRQFSGYLQVGTTKHLHYWLVEAENAPDAAPLVLWLNGGPGCSSLDGFIYEHGPFRTNPTDPTKLIRFPQTWASVANMLYLEAPAGVGFSYSTEEADYNTDDDKTAHDSAEALQAFFAAFPRYKKGAFFIAGESCTRHGSSNRQPSQAGSLLSRAWQMHAVNLSRRGRVRAHAGGGHPRFGRPGQLGGRHAPRDGRGERLVCRARWVPPPPRPDAYLLAGGPPRVAP